MATDNLQILQQMVDLQKQILTIMESQKKVSEDQIGVSQQAIKILGETADQSVKKLDSVQEAIQNSGDTLEKSLGGQSSFFTNVSEKLGDSKLQMKVTDKVMKGLWKTIVGGMFIGGFRAAWKSVTGQFTMVIDLAKTLVDVLAQVGKSVFAIGEAIFSIPVKVFAELIQMSNAFAQAWAEIQRKFEAFRGVFGDLNNQVGKSLKGALSGAKKMGELGGLGFFSVFQDSGVAIEFFQEQFKALGPMLDSFSKEIEQMGGKFVYFVKGMGLSGEQTKTWSQIAKSSGRTLTSVFEEVSNMTTQLADDFGLSNKQIASDVSDMAANVDTFGNTSVKVLAKTAVRVRSLGLEITALDGIINKFMNFEDAARNTSKLSQAFGMNIDALAMMKDANEGGGKSIDMLRQSFFAAGRDMDKMGTQEIKLMADATGLSTMETKLAFSMKNRGVAMDKIAGKADKAQKAPLTQAESMEKLADAIERVIRVFDYESFFQAFFMGFDLGVQHTDEFMTMLGNLHGALDLVRVAGTAVGRAFVKVFPGVGKMIKAVSSFFDPGDKKNMTDFKKFAEKLESIFVNLFEAIKTGDPKKVMKEFWDAFSGNFKELFGSGSDNASAFADGFYDFMTAIKKIIIGTIPMLKDSVIGLMKGLTSVIRNVLDPSQTSEGTIGQALVDALGPDGANFVETIWSDFLVPIWEAMVQAFRSAEFQDAMSDLGDAIVDLLKAGLEYVGNWMYDHPLVVLGAIAAIALVIGSAAAIALVSTAVSALFAGVGALVSGGLTVIGGLIASAFVAAIGLPALGLAALATLELFLVAGMTAIGVAIWSAIGAVVLSLSFLAGVVVAHAATLFLPFIESIANMYLTSEQWLLQTLASFTNWMSTLAETVFGKDNPVSNWLDTISTGFSTLIVKIEEFKKTIKETFASLTAAAAPGIALITPILDKIWGTEEKEPAITPKSQSNATGNMMQAIAKARVRGTAEGNEDLVAVTRDMGVASAKLVNEVEVLGNKTSQVQTADITAPIGNLAKGVMGVKDVIKVGASGMVINLTVTMDSEKMAARVVDTKTVAKKLMPK